MMSVCQPLLLMMHESAIIMHDGRLASDPFKIISLDSSLHEWNHPVSASTSIATPFAASSNTSAHHATVGNCDSVSSMSAAAWEPAAVQVYEESNDFCLENVLALVQHANFCVENYDHLISNDWIFGYALFFCARAECANNKQAFSGYALIIIEWPHMDILGHHCIFSSHFCICQNSFSCLLNNHP